MSVPHAIAKHIGVGTRQLIGVRATDMPERFYVIPQNDIRKIVDTTLPGAETITSRVLSGMTIVEALSAVVTQEVFFAALPEARPAPPPTA